MSQPDTEITAGLRALIRQWEAQARAARLRADQAGAYDVHQMTYQQGMEAAYKEAVRNARALLGESEAAYNAKPAAPPVIYEAVSVKEVQSILSRAGLNVRTLYNHSDNAFSAVFSKLQPATQDERLRALAAAHPHLIILESGILQDSGEFYIDFAFQPPDTP